MHSRDSFPRTVGPSLTVTHPFVLVALVIGACFGCTQGDGPYIPKDYQDPLHPQYMATPTELTFPDSGNVHLAESDYVQFKKDLLGFLESNNERDYVRHFGNYYVPETFSLDSSLTFNDSIFNMYVTMYNRWDSIGVSTRLDHWSLRYASPIFEGSPYDVGIAEVELRHHMVFEKHWTGNYKNFGRTLGERYPEADISYLDTTYVDATGDTVFRRHITAETTRLLYAVREHAAQGEEPSNFKWLNDGWQRTEMSLVMDSSAVALADAHRDSLGTLPYRPKVTGR